jgi:hypothetical protein
VPLDFNLDEVQHVEFGVGREDHGEETYVLLPVDGMVQMALREVAIATQIALSELEHERREYEPSERHVAQEYLFVPIASDLAENARLLHTANNLAMDQGALDFPSSLFCYFARFTDQNGRRLTGVRRATQFKGIVKSRLLQFLTDSLKIVEDKTFKLDHDFDFLVDSTLVHVLRPSGFEAVGKLQEAICAAVPDNINTISAQMEFVEFDAIAKYAALHPRAARHLASIRSLGETENISRTKLEKMCAVHAVGLENVNGRISVRPGFEMAFLNVLDRRMYELELVEGTPERYRAGSRHRISA